ncbi:MAG TPA: hypothetical protein VGD60_16165 [Candidatus Acidoferrales bacterium]
MDIPPKLVFGRQQWTVAFLCIALAAAGLAYRVITHSKLEQTSLLFIGVPALLAVLVTCVPNPKSVTGLILKGMTVGLLLSGPLLGEGFICVLMAAPVFYVVGILVGVVADVSRKSNNPAVVTVLLVLLPLSLEGTSSHFSFPRDETVQASRVVDAPASAVERALSRSPQLGVPLPFYLRLGFPHPAQAHGTGLEVGALRTIHFAGGEGQPGDLVLQVQQSKPGFAHFGVVSDQSRIAHWLDWKSSDVQWQEIDPGHTRVSWTINFRRNLDPSWYFRPWERYAVRLVAQHLIVANATPKASEFEK